MSTVPDKTVVSCYDLLDLNTLGGIEDYTEGMYAGDETRPYALAQRAQIDYLLDEVECGRDSHILDIGCGNGTLLEAARERGATGVGITVSPPQLRRCQAKGLEVHLLNYRDIPQDWNGKFNGIIANGSMEHFVQPQDAVEGKQDGIYRELFQICHRLLDPRSGGCKFSTTVIHFERSIAPQDLLKNPFFFPRNSDSFHYGMLLRNFGGFYPMAGQLQNCARNFFLLEKEVDGTRDYELTSEYWLKRLRTGLSANPRVMLGLVSKLLRHPINTLAMLHCLLISQSWNWQFRTKNPPTRLLRQTWKYAG